MSDVQAIVIGGGIVGLATAFALSARQIEVMVLEQHTALGTEVSSRSSEVIHAGLYYTPGSLKARLCVEGKKRLYQFANDNGVITKKLEKLVVANNQTELDNLYKIAKTAAINGAGYIKLLSANEARALEPNIRCKAALLSPDTGIVDSHDYILALEGNIVARGGYIVRGARVIALNYSDDEFKIEVDSGGERSFLTSRKLVNAAGLGATQVGLMLSSSVNYFAPATYLAKGYYFTLTGKSPFQRLVYPVPASGGLGVHLTLDTNGQAKFGPDIEWVSKLDYSFTDHNCERKNIFANEIQRYWPDLQVDRLQPAYAGIRPKITGAGEPPADFAIHDAAVHSVPGFVGLYGIESPGLTASLSIGEYVADRL